MAKQSSRDVLGLFRWLYSYYRAWSGLPNGFEAWILGGSTRSWKNLVDLGRILGESSGSMKDLEGSEEDLPDLGRILEEPARSRNDLGGSS